MKIFDSDNTIGALHIAESNSNCTLTWTSPAMSGKTGFLIVYVAEADRIQNVLEQVKQLPDGVILNAANRGAWLMDELEQNGTAVYACRSSENSFIFLDSKLKRPCGFQVWTILERDGEIGILCRGSQTCYRSVRVMWNAEDKIITPAQITGHFFNRKTIPAVTAACLHVSIPASANYIPGAVCYRIKGRPDIIYPLSRQALDRYIQLNSCHAQDLEVVAREGYESVYSVIKG